MFSSPKWHIYDSNYYYHFLAVFILTRKAESDTGRSLDFHAGEKGRPQLNLYESIRLYMSHEMWTQPLVVSSFLFPSVVDHSRCSTSKEYCRLSSCSLNLEICHCLKQILVNKVRIVFKPKKVECCGLFVPPCGRPSWISKKGSGENETTTQRLTFESEPFARC